MLTDFIGYTFSNSIMNNSLTDPSSAEINIRRRNIIALQAGTLLLRKYMSENHLPSLPSPTAPELPLYVPPQPQKQKKDWKRYLPLAVASVCILLFSSGVFALKQLQQPNATTKPTETTISKETKDTLPDRVSKPNVAPPTDNDAHKIVSPPPPTPTLQTYSEQLAAAQSLNEAQNILSAFGQNYSLSFSFTPPSSLYDGFKFSKLSESDLSSTKTFGQLFIKEWSKYPKDWLQSKSFRATPLIVFTAQVSDSQGVRRGGVYDNGNTMYFDIPTMISVPASDYSYARAVIHHEANHFAQAIIDGTVYYQDATWLSYNPPGFAYGKTIGSSYYHPLNGFVSQYAETNIAEDKAEVFSFIMTDQYRPALNSWLPSDANLSSKVTRMKQVMCAQWTTMCGGYYDNLH